MRYEGTSASERRYLPPAVAVSVVAFALRPPPGAVLGGTGTGAAASAGAAASSGEPAGPGPADRRRAPAPGGAPAGAEAGTTLWLPLVRRTRAPFLGRWALPGGPTEWHETLADTALRTLHAAVGRDPGYLEQLYSFGGVERSAEAQRLVTIAYWALYGEHELEACVPRGDAPAPSSGGGLADPGAEPRRRWDDPVPPAPPAPPAAARAGSPGAAPGLRPDPEPDPEPDPDPNVAWFSADDLPELAFDHAEIVAYALARLRTKTEYAAVAHRFLGPVFTLGRLRAVTEAVLGEPVDPANFRRQALAQGTLVDTGEVETGTRHRPARLYRFRGGPEPGLPGRPDHPSSTRSRP